MTAADLVALAQHNFDQHYGTCDECDAEKFCAKGMRLSNLAAHHRASALRVDALTRPSQPIEHHPDPCGPGCVARGSVTDDADGREHDECIDVEAEILDARIEAHA